MFVAYVDPPIHLTALSNPGSSASSLAEFETPISFSGVIHLTAVCNELIAFDVCVDDFPVDFVQKLSAWQLSFLLLCDFVAFFIVFCFSSKKAQNQNLLAVNLFLRLISSSLIFSGLHFAFFSH